MKNTSHKFLTLLFLALAPFTLFTQPLPPDPMANTGLPGAIQITCETQTSAPLIDNIVFLLALALLYGALKIFQARKRMMDTV